MPIFSLPSNYGIGTMGKEAYKFIDFLKESNQSYWQILPIGPTSYGDSPYSSFSMYAGNPYFIDLDILVEDGLLKKTDIVYKNTSEDYIDYEYLFNTREKILYKAYSNAKKKDLNEFSKFKDENTNWLKDYALFMSLKKYFGYKPWIEWNDDDIRFRKNKSINKYTIMLENDIEFYSFVQYLFYKQFYKLKEYANSNNIKLIGDVPIYVPLDSADCWVNPESFKLDDNYLPTVVSGVPSDFFNADGQLWGNPIYDWEYMKSNGYKWWIDRIGHASRIYDVIRIDHFRGFESFWTVEYGSKTAAIGEWIKGPNMDLLDKLKGWFSGVSFIAEDLGYQTDEVHIMLNNFGFPGMKVLQFSFDSRDSDGDKPYNFPINSVCYVGTHDNSTALGFLKEADKNDIKYCKEYLNVIDDDNFNWALIKAGMESSSILFVCQIQDYLGLDDKARINTPGTLGNNWKWRMKKNALNKKLAMKIAKNTKIYGRGRD